MKLNYKWLAGVAASVLMGIAITSCVDEIKFGSSFLEKAPGGTTGKDDVFSNAEYTRQFLTSIYALQYYGLPYGQKNDKWPLINTPYTGKFDALSDCWQLHWSSTAIYQQYYSGSHTAGDADSDKFSYTKNKVWEAVRAVWMLLENIDNVDDLGDDEKKEMKAEAYCLLAARYFDLFRHYGGLPLVVSTLDYDEEGSFQQPRATVEKTVDYMIGYLDEAINSGALAWNFEGTEAANSTGRWTKAGAMALKCKILQFAASPLFNDDKPYYGGSSKAEQDLLVWYGGYNHKLWEACRDACKAFFDANTGNQYKLNEAEKQTAEGYRQAYRMGYVLQNSPEVIHSVRVNGYERPQGDAYYFWYLWCDLGRNSYTPTQEYVEMFPWKDGRPFSWSQTESEGKLDEMFLTGTHKGLGLDLETIDLKRDPRLYESVRINGVPKGLNWTSGEMSDNSYELWIGGYDAQFNPRNENGTYATGYDNMKYYFPEYPRQNTQWVYLRLSDIYLTYAEALLQADNDFAGALEWVNKVRARVGLGKLEECNPDKNLTSNKQALLEEILRERACELGFEDSRFFDLIRYKKKSVFEKPLHGLHIYRLKEGSDTEVTETKWFDGDRNNGVKQPTRFKYEKFVLNNRRRSWWDSGFDPKWYLSPFPQTEVNKGYGLVQNPGW